VALLLVHSQGLTLNFFDVSTVNWGHVNWGQIFHLDRRTKAQKPHQRGSWSSAWGRECGSIV